MNNGTTLAFGILSAITGIAGMIVGSISIYISLKSIKQDLYIIKTEPEKLCFRVTNMSLRPIPVQSLTLEILKSGNGETSKEPVELNGIKLPGVLPPESC